MGEEEEELSSPCAISSRPHDKHATPPPVYGAPSGALGLMGPGVGLGMPVVNPLPSSGYPVPQTLCEPHSCAPVSVSAKGGRPVDSVESLVGDRERDVYMNVFMHEHCGSTQPKERQEMAKKTVSSEKTLSSGANPFKLTSRQELKEREREQKDRERERVKGIVRQVLLEQEIFQGFLPQTVAHRGSELGGSADVRHVKYEDDKDHHDPGRTTLTQATSSASPLVPQSSATTPSQRSLGALVPPLSQSVLIDVRVSHQSRAVPPSTRQPASARLEGSDSHDVQGASRGDREPWRPSGMAGIDTVPVTVVETAARQQPPQPSSAELEASVQKYLAELAPGRELLGEPRKPEASFRVFFSVHTPRAGKTHGGIGEAALQVPIKEEENEDTEDSESECGKESSGLRLKTKFLKIRIDCKHSSPAGQEAADEGASTAGRLTWKPTVTTRARACTHTHTTHTHTHTSTRSHTHTHTHTHR